MKPVMNETYETKDIVTATYLKICGHYCIGTIPAGNKHRPMERVWLFENTDELIADLSDLADGGDPIVPIRQVFHSSSILKNLLNDKDTLDG